MYREWQRTTFLTAKEAETLFVETYIAYRKEVRNKDLHVEYAMMCDDNNIEFSIDHYLTVMNARYKKRDNDKAVNKLAKSAACEKPHKALEDLLEKYNDLLSDARSGITGYGGTENYIISEEG